MTTSSTNHTNRSMAVIIICKIEKKRHFLIASKQHARHAISLRTSLSKLILVDLVIKCELHHDNCNRAVEARLKVKLMPPYANPRMRLRRGLVDHVLRHTISRQNAFEPRSSSSSSGSNGSSSCCRLWGILKCGLAQGQLAVAVAVAAARAAFAQACNQFFCAFSTQLRFLSSFSETILKAKTTNGQGECAANNCSPVRANETIRDATHPHIQCGKFKGQCVYNAQTNQKLLE